MIDTFAALLSKGARVLVAGFADQEGRDIDRLRGLGVDARGFDPSEEKVTRAQSRLGTELAWRAELFFAKLEREAWDGAWINQSLTPLPPDACRRAMALLFQALRPGGHLCIIFDEPDENGKNGFKKDDFASLVRQNGFTILGEGHHPHHPRQVGLLARRVGDATATASRPDLRSD